MVRAFDCQIAVDESSWQISCAISSSDPLAPKRMFYRFLGPPPRSIPLRLDAFVPPLALLAVATKEPLVIDGPVSAALCRQVPVAMRLWRSWNAAFQPVPLSADEQVVPEKRALAAAGFFSGGVDSIYTLLKIRSRYQSDDPRQIRRLIFCHGFDIPLNDQARFERALANVTAVAAAADCTVLPCVTNAREVVGRVSWPFFGYGPCLGGVALAAEAVADTVYVPSGYSYDQLHDDGANGSHPILDPLWSNEVVDLIHSGAEADRATKIAAIAASPITRAHLRVCWQNTSADHNCCRCEKCLRTMVELELHGALRGSPAFPRPLTPEALRTLKIDPHLVLFWQNWVDRARAGAVDPQLVRVVEEIIARDRFDRSGIGRRLNRFVVRPLGRIGLTPARVKELDDAVLGGRLTAAIRRSRRSHESDSAADAARH